MSAPRQVVVDDTDTQILYFGQGWFQDQGSQDALGNFGPTYRKTSHGTNNNNSLSFSFAGTSITVFGTTDLVEIDNGTRFDPSWECFIDGVSIGENSPFQYPENNWILCNQTSLSDGPHELSINVTTAGNTFWFDYVTYIPSPAVSYDSAVLLVDNTDPAIAYGAGWSALGDTANMTTVAGSLATFDFVGTSVTWVGFIPTELPHNASVGTYSIDNGAPVTFKLDGLPTAAAATAYNQAFFTTPSLIAGPHTLFVTYGGSSEFTPLTLDYILLTNTSLSTVAGSTSASVAASSTLPITTSPTPSDYTTSQAKHSGTSVGAIVGGIVGGLALVAIVLLIFWWNRRRRATHIESQPGFLGTGNAAPPRQPRYGITPSMQHLQADPFILPHPPASIQSPNGSDESYLPFSGSSSDTRDTHAVHAVSRPLPHIPLYTHGTTIDSSDVTGYAPGTIDQLRAMRKGQQMTPSPAVIPIVHQDSGIRLPNSNATVDIPPLYTAA